MLRIEKASDGYCLGDSDIPTRSSKCMSNRAFDRHQRLRAIYDPTGRMGSYPDHPDHLLNQNPWE